MRAAIALAPSSDPLHYRRVLHGAGLTCYSEDCVPWDAFGVQLSQQDVDLVLVEASDQAPFWSALQDASELTSAPVFAFGDFSEPAFLERVRAAALAGTIERQDIRTELDRIVENMSQQSTPMGVGASRRRGTITSVISPMPGSGGTTVACQLAGALAQMYPDEVGLVEVAKSPGDLALLLDLAPETGMDGMCQRWEHLDGGSLGQGFAVHATGLHALVNRDDREGNLHLSKDSVRRIAVLSRSIYSFVVLALDRGTSEEELESLRLSDEILIVMRPDVPSVRRVQHTVDFLLDQNVNFDRLQLVINQTGQGGQLPKKQITETLGMDAIHEIPSDPQKMNRAVNQGKLLVETARFAKISRRFASLAKSLRAY